MCSRQNWFFSVLLVFLFLLLCSSCTSDSLKNEEAVEQVEVFVPQNLQKKVPDSGAKVHFIHLTNGEASLVQLFNGEYILIDTGSESSLPELMDYLQSQQVKVIKHVILTSNNNEHSGNVKAISEIFPIEHVYFPYHLEKHFVDEIALDQVKFHPLRKKGEINFDSQGKIMVWNPGQQLSLSPQDHSLVFQLTLGRTIFLFTSSITDKIERELISESTLHSHILKVSDFGSNQASDPEFLEKVNAHVAIIFHRPGYYLDPEVLERLQESWMDVYPLKEHGHIVIVCEKDDYELFVVPSKQDY
jgi:competence protein ComEC